MPSIPIWLAAVPLGCYLVALGLVHRRRRPLVLAGAWDAVCLAAGVSGLVMVGPMAVLEPAVSAIRWSWAVMGLLALVALALAILVSRPRLVVYNATIEQLRPAVAEVVMNLDPTARWAGETVAMPSRGLQIHMEGASPRRNVTLVALGQRPSPESWGEFSRRLKGGVELLRVTPSPWAGLFLACGSAVLLGAAWSAIGGL